MKALLKLIGRESETSRPLVLHEPSPHAGEWPSFGEEEGQLALDIYQTDESVVIKSTIAGASAGDIEISLVEDMLTIKGRREQAEEVASDAYLYRECYWGRFSRSVVLPVEVKHDKINASLHNGVLTIILPKARRVKPTTIRVKERDV